MDRDESSYDCSDDEADSLEPSDDCFDEPAVTRHDVGFAVLDEEACLALASKVVEEVSVLLCCGAEVAHSLLRSFKWDRERLIEEYMTDCDACAKTAGIHLGADKSITHSPTEKGIVRVGGVPKTKANLPPIQCQICFEHSTEYSALQCGHAYCNACYCTYAVSKVADEGHGCVYGRCPAEQCHLVLSKALVASLLTDEAHRASLEQFARASSLSRSFVDDNAHIKWCPGADCGKAIQARPGVTGVACTCGTRFCFKCGNEDHSPCSCEDLKRWIAKCKDDSETSNWLMANTKACPKCQTSIEKNGGCNHMTCRNGACKFEFCWVCCGAWKDHLGSFYACNKYDPRTDKDKKKKQDSSRAALERYLHHYARFTNHDNSLKLETEAKVMMEKKVKEMEALGNKAWIDCRFLNEANEALHECRYALKFTYVYAFYLPEKHNFRIHFEMQQMELEKQTEELAEQLERAVEDIDHMKVVNCYHMARKRKHNLFEIVEARHHQEDEGGSSSG
ncbi:hypothetical protein AB1Y20_016069 [Prymnesium parvum]|uniref:RBR-type E3 ubiquitin transferase n=1 Tax=Prymnesium parvum TaxID=97485 RepID=A0AB34K385_PRYPA